MKNITIERILLFMFGLTIGYLTNQMSLHNQPIKLLSKSTQIELATPKQPKQPIELPKPLEKIDAQEGVPIKQVVSGEIKTGQIWESNIPDPFIEKFSITIVDIKDGYVQFVCNESNRKSSCPQYWISECYKLKE